jgi:hypothetical protein
MKKKGILPRTARFEPAFFLFILTPPFTIMQHFPQKLPDRITPPAGSSFVTSSAFSLFPHHP